jgi:hypothetical protein
MGRILTEIGLCAAAVFGYWQSYVTGGGITAVVALYEKLSGHTLPRSAYLVMFLAVFVPMSLFLAWREEYQQAQLLDDRRRQQQTADQYAPLLERGRSIMVYWVDASLKKDSGGIDKYRHEAFEWLTSARERINVHRQVRDDHVDLRLRIDLRECARHSAGLQDIHTTRSKERAQHLERVVIVVNNEKGTAGQVWKAERTHRPFLHLRSAPGQGSYSRRSGRPTAGATSSLPVSENLSPPLVVDMP